MIPKMQPALLEEWMRRYYFSTEIDIGSSGVQDFSVRELRELLDIEQADFDDLVLRDSETFGGAALREALADAWSGGDASMVMATHGSSEANFLLMNTLLEPGDEVVVSDPCYPQLFLIAKARGCQVKYWPLRLERRFEPAIDELGALIGNRTRMVVVNFPHNPTGATLTPAGQRELVAAAARVGAYLVWDDAFGEITYGDAPPLPGAASLYERAIVMGTLSKCFGLPGLRVGWCIAQRDVLIRCAQLRDYITLHLSPLVEMVAARAVAQRQKLVEPRREQARRNLAIVASWAERHGEWIDWVPPRGGVSTFPRLAGSFDVEEFCHTLAREQRTMLVPGICFGHHRHVRLGFGGPTEKLRQGLDRLGLQLTRTFAARQAAAVG